MDWILSTTLGTLHFFRTRTHGRGNIARVFIYGTLLPGEGNHELLATALRIGAARTLPVYELVDLDAYPAMVAGGGTAIAGEVWEVDAATLDALDRLEEHPGYYYRETIQLEDGQEALVYLLLEGEVTGLPRIASGDWCAR